MNEDLNILISISATVVRGSTYGGRISIMEYGKWKYWSPSGKAAKLEKAEFTFSNLCGYSAGRLTIDCTYCTYSKK